MNKTATPEHVKIAFEIEDEDDPEVIEIETLWAMPKGTGYELDNIPFYVYGVACGDIVSATPDGNGQLLFEDVLRPSGNSCIRLLFSEPGRVQSVRQQLRELGCDSELNGVRLVAVNVPAAIDYEDVRAYLEKLEAAGVADYEEACLAQE